MKKIGTLLILSTLVMTMLLSGCSLDSRDNISKKSNNNTQESSGNVITNTNSTSKIFVESEFAPLKRVVLTQSEAYNSDGSNFLSPDDQRKYEKERENLRVVLEKYGVEILRPRLLTPTEIKLGTVKNGFTDATGTCNFFVRDPFFTIGDNIIEGAFKSTWRRIEVLPIRDTLIKESLKNKNYYVSIPQTDVSQGVTSDIGPFLEGGDVLVYGKTVFVGNSGQASNDAGINWLRNYLTHFGYKVVEVKLDKETLHLDCALSLVKEGLLIACDDALPEGLPDELKSWDKITVSYDDAKELATNGLPINEKVYITDPVFKNTVGKELEKRGINVEYVDFEISRSFGGAFRCSTQPLLRVN